jgi:hypothetical protein
VLTFLFFLLVLPFFFFLLLKLFVFFLPFPSREDTPDDDPGIGKELMPIQDRLWVDIWDEVVQGSDTTPPDTYQAKVNPQEASVYGSGFKGSWFKVLWVYACLWDL